jgi:ribonuclease Z
LRKNARFHKILAGEALSLNKKFVMRLDFWGVRGTFPCTSLKGSQIGRNTPCVSVTYLKENEKSKRQLNEQTLIFDAGTGLNELNKHLDLQISQKICLFFTHYHHDHLMGLSHFTPLFLKNSQVTFYGQSYQNSTVKDILGKYFEKPFFPLSFKNFPGAKNFRFQDLKPNFEYKVQEFSIKTFPLNHPQGALAYRCSLGDRSWVYATDHEETKPSDELIHFLKNTDVLIMDTSYLHDQWKKNFRGWGHSSCAQIAKLASKAQVKKLFLFHYGADTSDYEIKNKFLAESRPIFPETFLSQEGESVWI